MKKPRVAYPSLVANAYNGMVATTVAIKEKLDPKLVDLVFQRISQINACAYCVDMHWHDLVIAGEDAQRLNSLATWREVDFYSERECAALHWAERVTQLHGGHPTDDDYAAVRELFSEEEIAALTYAIAIMNAWNRMAISMQSPVARRNLK